MKIVVDFVFLVVVYFLVFYKKWKAKGIDVLFINTTMYIYLSFVLFFTLMPILTSIPFMFNHPYKTMNFVLFVDVLNGRGDFIRQLILNIVMTIPFGFLLPIVKKGKIGLLKVSFFTFLLSFSIELLQPLINGFRSADITDIVTNMTGGIIGYIIYSIFKNLIGKILKYIRNCNKE